MNRMILVVLAASVLLFCMVRIAPSDPFLLGLSVLLYR